MAETGVFGYLRVISLLFFKIPIGQWFFCLSIGLDSPFKKHSSAHLTPFLSEYQVKYLVK